MKNLGFIYNKDIFKNLKISLNGKKEKEGSDKLKYYFYEPLTKEIKVKKGEKEVKKTISTDFGKYNNEFLSQELNERYEIGIKTPQSFKIQTLYPGLILGSGYTHEIGGMEEEFQLGFFFDHTTGRPIIPGSSIKGVLRYACEVNKGDYLKQKLTDLKIESSSYFEAIIAKNKKGNEVVNPSEFVYNVFEGKLLEKDEKGQVKWDKQGKPIVKQNSSIYERDIFLDAFPIHSNGALFGSDYITPHKNPLKDPIPIKFLRVQPEVTYQFNFILKESNGLDADKKQKIFQQIILDLGLGAKANVGYGQFTELSKEQIQEQKKQEYVRNYEPYTPSYNPTDYLNEQKTEVTIIDITDTDIAFKDNVGSVFSKTIKAINTKFEKDLKRKRKKNPEIAFKELQKDMKIQIRFNKNISEGISFTVLPIIREY